MTSLKKVSPVARRLLDFTKIGFSSTVVIVFVVGGFGR